MAAAYIDACNTPTLSNVTYVDGTTGYSSNVLNLSITTPSSNCYLLCCGTNNTSYISMGINGAISSFYGIEETVGCCINDGMGGLQESSAGTYSVNITNSGYDYVSGILVSIQP
jgi:hypothetical protein